MSETSGDIIIKGGSVQLYFDEALYEKNSSDSKKYANSNRKIKRIQIEDDAGATIYDSGDYPGGLPWTIRVFTK